MNQKLEGRELVLYLMSRFTMTEEEAERMVAEATWKKRKEEIADGD